jgi:hypothetical protein
MADDTQNPDGTQNAAPAEVQPDVNHTVAADATVGQEVKVDEVVAAQAASDSTDLRSGDVVAPTLSGRTSDSDDVNRDWTVQSEKPFVDVIGRPGQAFVAEQLPRPEVQIAAGIDPVIHAAGLTIVDRAPEDKALVPDDVLSGRV